MVRFAEICKSGRYSPNIYPAMALFGVYLYARKLSDERIRKRIL